MEDAWYRGRRGLLVEELRPDGITCRVVGRGLHVGDLLSLARRCEYEVTAEYANSWWAEEPRRISLTVTAIHAFRQEVQELDAGYSALVEVEGDTRGLSPGHDVLVTDSA